MSHLEERFGSLYSIPNLLMETLNISRSSAYKKYNGQVALSLEELELLHTKFKLPVSSFLDGQSKFSFQLDTFDKKPDHPVDYLTNMANHFQEYLKYSDVEFIYMANEIPIFHLFNFPDLLKVRLYIWDYTNWNTDFLKDEFEFDSYNDQLSAFELSRTSVLNSYLSLNSVEIWNSGFLDSLFEQIKYLIESYIIVSRDIINRLCDNLIRLSKYLSTTLQTGTKIDATLKPSESKLKVYNNQLIMTPLIIYGKSLHFDAIYTMLDIPNYMFCDEPQVNEKLRGWIEKVISHSKRISSQGRKDQKQFVIRLKKKIDFEINEIQALADYLGIV